MYIVLLCRTAVWLDDGLKIPSSVKLSFSLLLSAWLLLSSAKVCTRLHKCNSSTCISPTRREIESLPSSSLPLPSPVRHNLRTTPTRLLPLRLQYNQQPKDDKVAVILFILCNFCAKMISRVNYLGLEGRRSKRESPTAPPRPS